MTSKWAKDCSGLQAFEEEHGQAAVEEVLERICDELWNRGQQKGLNITDIESHGRIPDDHTVTGSVEYKEVWYEFELRTGVSAGTEVLYFDRVTEPSELDVDRFKQPAYLLEKEFARLLESSPAHKRAAGDTIRHLVDKYKLTRLSGCSEQVHALLRPLIGDLALQSQDYFADAVALAKTTLVDENSAHKILEHLSPEVYRAVRKAHLASDVEFEHDFFNQALAEVVRQQLFA